MSAAVFAAVAGLLGVLVGRFWDTRADSANWKRDQRIRIYEGLADSYYKVREALRVLAMSEPGSAESDAAEVDVYKIAASGWNQHVVSAWLHGSPAVIRTVEALDRCIVNLLPLARARRLTWEEFMEERKPVQVALEQFIEAVREELRQPALRVTVNYSFYGLPESRKAADAEASRGKSELIPPGTFHDCTSCDAGTLMQHRSKSRNPAVPGLRDSRDPIGRAECPRLWLRLTVDRGNVREIAAAPRPLMDTHG